MVAGLIAVCVSCGDQVSVLSLFWASELVQDVEGFKRMPVPWVSKDVLAADCTEQAFVKSQSEGSNYREESLQM